MILSAGEILVDKVVSRDGEVCHVGGAPFNVAVRARQAGAEVRFFGCVGADEMGEFLLSRVAQYGVEISLTMDSSRATTVALVSLDETGERFFRFLRDNAADYSLDPAKLDWAGVTTLHLGTLMLNEPIGRAFFEQSVLEDRKRGVRITLDANFRDDLFASEKERNEVMKPYLMMADVLKLGHDELASLTGRASIDEGARALAFDGLLFVTMGSKGSAVYQAGKLLAQAPAPIVERVVDTTGAGDAFFGTVVALLDMGAACTEQEMRQVLTKANQVGAQATQTEGAI